MEYAEMKRIGQYSGWAMLASLVVGVTSAVFITHGIDINMTADVKATAENMLNAEQRLRAKAYSGVLLFALDIIVSFGFFLLLQNYGRLMSGWSLLMALGGSTVMLLGAVNAMTAAEIAGDSAFVNMGYESQRLLLAGLQATTDYTSFHLGLVIAIAAKAGFFILFFKSGLIPRFIAAWGIFASIFVGGTIFARDFIPALGDDFITMAFMLCNLLAIILTGAFMSVSGVKEVRG